MLINNKVWAMVMALILINTASVAAQNQEFRTYEKPLYTKEWSAPSRYPDRISLTLSGDPATSFSVSWRTNTAVKKAFIELARATAAPRFWRNAKTYTASTQTMDARQIENARVISNYHTFTFSGLQPNTLYAYRVGDGEVWSEWIQYKTASKNEEPFSFLYVGDAQNQILELWSRLIREGFRKEPDARFIVHAGDLINRAHNDSEWHEWFDAGGFIHRMLPAIPVPGNHEYNEFNSDEEQEHLSVQWKYQFELPQNGPEGINELDETTYYVDYQGVRMIGLNSNGRHEEQAVWLEKILADNPNRWTIATFHHPVFSASRGRDNDELRKLWKPLFDKYHVDLVLQGHDHSYARGITTPAQAENVMSGINMRDRTGPVYVVSVSGGKMYSLKPQGWSDYEAERLRAGENTQLFQLISVNKDTLYFKSYTATQELYDAFKLIKNEGGPNRLVEIKEQRIPERTHNNTISYEHPVVMDFEYDNLGDWNLDQANNAVNVTDTQARTGRHSAVFRLKPGDTRSYITDLDDARYGYNTWYGFSTFIPGDFSSKQPVDIAFWDGNSDNDFERNERPPAITLQIKNGKLLASAYKDDRFESTKESITPVKLQLSNNRIKKDSWNDIVARINWLYNGNGKLELWLNGKRLLSYEGPIGYNDDDGPTFSLGLAGGDTESERVITHDAYRKGNTFDDVDPAKFDQQKTDKSH